MPRNSPETFSLRLVWVFPGYILNTLDAATWLEITKEMRNLGWRVDLVTAGPAGKHVVQGVDVLCFPQPNIYFIRHLIFHLRVVRYILRNWNLIDVVFFHQISLPWLLPLRLLNIFSKKHPILVMDTRTIPMESVEKATFKDKLRGKFYFLMNRLANRSTDGQTTITQRMADLLCIPREKHWGTWPSGVNTDKFSIAQKNRQWPDSNDPVNIIYIGILNYERNLMTLCQAVVEANHQGMNFILLLYGEGTEKKDLEVLATQANESIKVYDSIPHDQVPGILSRAHVGALPFPDEEKYKVSSPIKLFEYMGSGMPILATKIVCHTDVMGNNDFVFWAENANLDGILDAIRQIWQARFTLSKLGKKALVAASDWTYVASAKRLNDALQYGLSPKVKDK
jgi:glycosyltransferase involved in cell wall biosynthesis